MKLITGIVPQETFPQEDLLLDNADLLCLMLANEAILTGAHAQVESASAAARYAHPVLRGTVESLPGANNRAKSAFDLGITLYEAITGFVRLRPPTDNLREIVNQTHAAITAANDQTFEYFERADDSFRNGRPYAWHVVWEAAGRFSPGVVDYATYGAALACQFELDLANRPR